MARLQKSHTVETSLEVNNRQVKDTDAISSPRLEILPGEILSKIMRFTMMSDTPVYFWLFLDLDYKSSEVDRLVGRSHSRQSTRAFLYRFTLPEAQEEHVLDWRLATSVSRRLRLYGKPAFFNFKEFIIPPNMLRTL